MAKDKKLIQEQGKCPKCGSYDLDYGSSDVDGESMGYEYTCNKCGSYGKEWYNLVYVETTLDGEAADGTENL